MNERIKEIRKYHNLTLEKFGERLGVGKTAISKIERGENNVTDQMCKLICREFSINEDWLKTGEGEMFVELDRENQLMLWAGRVLADETDSFRKRFVRMLSQLTENEWKFIEEKAMELFAEHNKKD